MTRARLTTVCQVSGRACAASMAAAFAATDAGLPSPAAPPGGCRECPPAVMSWFIPVTSLQQPVPAHSGGQYQKTRHRFYHRAIIRWTGGWATNLLTRDERR